MDIFTIGLACLIVLCALLTYQTRGTSTGVKDGGFNRFQQIYLSVYLLAMMGDWLQGPHVYALYESYNMDKHQIEILFIAGFGSSMLFGTIVGSFADKFGRRFNCLLYGGLYSVACMTKHFNNFNVLLFGRFLAGISTSILYSAFESWLIYEHKMRGFEEFTLGTLFANAYFGNSIVAILAGIIAQYAANIFGYVAPFDVAMLVLASMTTLVFFTWSENHGDSQAHLKQSFIAAYNSIKTDRKVLYLGLIQSLFEGSMYVFVLEWTPALTIDTSAMRTDSSNPPIPHGFIFAAFMVAIMIGSSLFKILSSQQDCEQFMRGVLAVAATTLLAPILFRDNQLIIFVAFVTFEICVGIFWPAMGTMRGRYVPETARSTIMNFFRIPLNLLVVLILWQNINILLIFKCCVLFLSMATVFQHLLYKAAASQKTPPTPESSPEKVALVEQDV